MKIYYKKIKLKDGTTKDEHRLIMEHHIGRKLKRNEVVHHINGNKLDNRIENLQLMTLSEHARMHGEQYKASDETKEKIRQIVLGKPKTNFKYSLETINEVKTLRSQGVGWHELSRLTKIPKTTIMDLVQDKYLCYKTAQ